MSNRHAEALGLTAPAAIAVQIKSPEKRVFRTSWVLGDKGLSLEMPAPFEPDRTVEVAFVPPDGQPESVQANARLFCLDHEAEDEGQAGAMGLVFLDLSPSDSARLQAYVKARLAMPELA